MITLINTKNSKIYNKKIKSLYESSFPKEEQVPFFLLSYNARKNISDIFAIVEENKFIGMLCCVYYKDIVFLWYLAIERENRGKGYGTKVIEETKKIFSKNRLVLNVEEVNIKYKNYEEREKRKQFYIKNGFQYSGFMTKEYGVVYEMLCYRGEISYQEYKEMMITYSGEKVFHKIYKLVE